MTVLCVQPTFLTINKKNFKNPIYNIGHIAICSLCGLSPEGPSCLKTLLA